MAKTKTKLLGDNTMNKARCKILYISGSSTKTVEEKINSFLSTKVGKLLSLDVTPYKNLISGVEWVAVIMYTPKS